MARVAHAVPSVRVRLLTSGRQRLARLRSDRQPLTFRVTLWLLWLGVAAMAGVVVLMPTRQESTSWWAVAGALAAMGAVLAGHSAVCGWLSLLPPRRAAVGRLLASFPLLLPASLVAYTG